MLLSSRRFAPRPLADPAGAAAVVHRSHDDYNSAAAPPRSTPPRARRRAPLVLRHRADVAALEARVARLFTPLHVRALAFAFDGVALPPQAAAREARLNAGLRACGCSAANYAACVAALGYVVALFAFAGAPPGWRWAHFALGCAVCFAGGAVGRALSHVRVRARLRAELRALHAELGAAAAACAPSA